MMFPQPRSQRLRHSDMLPSRSRILTSPALSIEYGDDTPEVKILSPIKIETDYINADYFANLKRIQKLNSIVESYFTPTPNLAPFSNDEWRNALQANTPKQTIQEKLYTSLRRGLPEELRKEIWLYLAETQRLEREHQAKGITYETLKAQVCPNEEKIRKDVIRSFAELEFFKTHKPEKLAVVQNVLEAYSNLDPEVGYTQGMNFFVGVIFSFLQPVKLPDEEETDDEDENFTIDPKVEKDVFWILVYIMQDMSWRMLYVNNTPKLQQLISKLDDNITKKLPKISRIMTDCLPACFAQYFLTILLFHSPPELAMRILEAFLVVGEDFLIHILIEALKYSEKKIVDTEELADLFNFLRNHLLKCIGL